jgi:hypothetical protein
VVLVGAEMAASPALQPLQQMQPQTQAVVGVAMEEIPQLHILAAQAAQVS